MATQLTQAGNQLLTELVMDIKNGSLRRCEAFGLTDDEIRLLNNLTIDDLHFLSQSPVSIITCQIHRENLRLLLTRAKEMQCQNMIIERCLTLGASIELLNHYFGLIPSEVSVRRRLSGIRMGVGRSQSLTDEQRIELWHRWQQGGSPTLDNQSGLMLMILCAEHMNVSLTTVWNMMQEWGQDGLLSDEREGQCHAK